MLEYFHKALEALPTLAKGCALHDADYHHSAPVAPCPAARGGRTAAGGGVLFGPHVLDDFPPQHPILQFLSNVSMLLLICWEL
jgi:hypothetical protein